MYQICHQPGMPAAQLCWWYIWLREAPDDCCMPPLSEPRFSGFFQLCQHTVRRRISLFVCSQHNIGPDRHLCHFPSACFANTIIAVWTQYMCGSRHQNVALCH
eukprot:GHRQ01014861.1.p1 GENE.GHRQ01014861.1~~GHRQ01014861.1.p1  ORF type:complete len:103 (+),score=3.81 GHRQ01014861.1:1051-1359(+)